MYTRELARRNLGMLCVENEVTGKSKWDESTAGGSGRF